MGTLPLDSHLHLHKSKCFSAGDHNTHLGLGTSGDGLADDCTGLEEGEASPDAQPQQGRRMRREACTCPYCKDNEGR